MRSPVVIRPCTVSDLEASPRFKALLAEYGVESGIPEFGPPVAQMATYKHLEALGALQVIAAVLDGELVGFVTVLRSVLPHFGRQVAITESLFVADHARSTGAGLALLHAAEDLAREQGGEALLVSAPTGGRLAKVLPGVGYREASRVYFRELT